MKREPEEPHEGQSPQCLQQPGSLCLLELLGGSEGWGDVVSPEQGSPEESQGLGTAESSGTGSGALTVCAVLETAQACAQTGLGCSGRDGSTALRCACLDFHPCPCEG